MTSQLEWKVLFGKALELLQSVHNSPHFNMYAITFYTNSITTNVQGQIRHKLVTCVISMYVCK